MAGAPVRMRSTATLQGPCGDVGGHAAQPVLQALDHGRIVVADLEQHFGAPGMMLGAPGSSVMRPVVQTVRGPQIAGKRSSIATQNFASARPASLRIAIRVVPA